MARRVLVVDDEPAWRTGFHAALTAADIEVDAVSGTAQADGLLRAREYGMVLLDVVLGAGVDTLDCQRFLDTLTRRHPALPIVAATGKHLEPPEVVAIVRYGVAEFLYKPRIRLPELRQLVRNVLDGASGQYRYDVFLSYSWHDRGWVEETLVPALERAGLHVAVDYLSFEPGAPSLNEMQRCVRESRRTVFVLSPAWVSSPWTALEARLVQMLDPDGTRRRALPVLLRPCEPPPWMASLVYVDFTADARSRVQLARLIAAIPDQR